jgi:hypothetical protein
MECASLIVAQPAIPRGVGDLLGLGIVELMSLQVALTKVVRVST